MPSNRMRTWLLAGALAALLGTGALAATASTPARQTLLDQLQRPAVPHRGPSGPAFDVARRSGSSGSVSVTATPNRASRPNRLSVRVADRGRPLRGAHVTVSFSMPSMRMWNAYTTALSAAGAGRYTAAVPVLGMAGRWQLRVDVAPPGRKRFRLTVDDRVGA
jgi:hypothetical protein